ncbi:MAG: hypothetical protein Q9191_003148, partial [Dirinaria sp. TL-2023a]
VIENSRYRKTAHYNVTHRRRQNFYAMKSRHWQMLSKPPFNILSTLESVDDAIDANGDIADQILKNGLPGFALAESPQSPDRDWRGTASAEDMGKARTTIKQFYRDWSAEGAAERRACNEPVLQDVHQLNADVVDKGKIKILVPGAGLGRLVFELCKSGYTVEGNEISYHQLVASSWVLNHCQRAEQYTLFPFALDFNNVISRSHQLRSMKIPDVHPATELEVASVSTPTHAFQRMSMTASDFVSHYGGEECREMFDVVASVFFIDTAPNVIRYMEVVHNCLKPGGVWINVGPLLWHFSDRAPKDNTEVTDRRDRGDGEGVDEPGSVELTVQEVLLLVELMGFEITKHELREGEAGYIQNPESLLLNTYRLSHWIAKKKCEN